MDAVIPGRHLCAHILTHQPGSVSRTLLARAAKDEAVSDEKRRNNDRGNEKCGAKLTSVFGSDPASALKYAVHKIAGAPDAARREVAEYYDVSASTAVIWVKCFRETGRCSAKPRGGSTSPLEEHAQFLLALVDEQPELTWTR